MKDIAEKFDHLPQDFDREAIWNGIEKPKRRFPFRAYYWAALFGLVGICCVCYWITVPPEAAVNTFEHAGLDLNTVVLEKEVVPRAEAATPELDLATATATPPSIATIQNRATHNPAAIPILASQETTINQMLPFERTELLASERTHRERLRLPAMPLDSQLTGAIDLLPGKKQLLVIGMDQLFSNGQAVSEIRPKKKRHRLALQAGIGVHGTRYSSTTEEALSWRNDLEKPQIDYSLGLRYEYALTRKLFLSASTTYQLYKDQISTTYVREARGQDTLINYQLYNHYHLLSGQLAAGRRFYQPGFFWDIQAGIGLTYHQVAQVDYFVGAGELADQRQVAQDYQNLADVFYTGQIAIGKQLTSRFYARAGGQISSRKTLTASRAATRHRIFPVNAFLELGIRF
jgi:hypothetical protein